MKQYYAIYPGSNGLVLDSLGMHDSFDSACDFDSVDASEYEREPSIWISDEKDIQCLFDSMKRQGFGSK